MRRAKTTSGLSPQQLKHFAIIALVLTGLLALFVSGEDWGAQAQVQAVQAKNDLAKKQRDKLGTTELASSMAVKQANQRGFGEDAGPGAMGNTGGGRAIAPVPVRPSQLSAVPPKPGTRSSLSPAQAGLVSKDQLRTLESASRQRSGSPSPGD